jgi:hypothetical protein
MSSVGLVGYITFSFDGLDFSVFNQKLVAYYESIKISIRKKECFDIPYAYKKTENWFLYFR